MKYHMLHSTSHLQIDGCSISKRLVECSMRFSSTDEYVALSPVTKVVLCMVCLKHYQKCFTWKLFIACTCIITVLFHFHIWIFKDNNWKSKYNDQKFSVWLIFRKQQLISNLVHNNEDAGTVSVMSIAEKISGSNAILDIQNFDNLIGWMLEMLCLRC